MIVLNLKAIRFLKQLATTGKTNGSEDENNEFKVDISRKAKRFFMINLGKQHSVSSYTVLHHVKHLCDLVTKNTASYKPGIIDRGFTWSFKKNFPISSPLCVKCHVSTLALLFLNAHLSLV